MTCRLNFWVHDVLVKNITPPPGGGAQKSKKYAMAKLGELQGFTLTLVRNDRVGRTRTKRAIQKPFFNSNKFRAVLRSIYQLSKFALPRLLLVHELPLL